MLCMSLAGAYKEAERYRWHYEVRMRQCASPYLRMGNAIMLPQIALTAEMGGQRTVEVML